MTHCLLARNCISPMACCIRTLKSWPSGSMRLSFPARKLFPAISRPGRVGTPTTTCCMRSRCICLPCRVASISSGSFRSTKDRVLAAPCFAYCLPFLTTGRWSGKRLDGRTVYATSVFAWPIHHNGVAGLGCFRLSACTISSMERSNCNASMANACLFSRTLARSTMSGGLSSIGRHCAPP